MIELNKVYNEDCLLGMKKIDENSIDTIVTSPPYNKKGLAGGRQVKGNALWKNFNIDYDEYDDNMIEEEYQKWQVEILNECYRVMKDCGSMFYNHKIRRFKNKAYSPLEWILKSNFKLYQVIIWNRKSSPNQNKAHLLPTTEYIYWLTKDKPKVFKNEIPKEYRKEIWDIKPARNPNHPAPFPELIPELCIKLTTEEKDIVLDPFNGSGTTSSVAESLNRNYIGFEISENYIKNKDSGIIKKKETK